MKMFILSLVLACASAMLLQAGEVCDTRTDCKAAVQAKVQQMRTNAKSGPKWQLSKAGCEIASREQVQTNTRCRSYDQQPGGKTPEQCAKCYTQVVFDTARWEQCHQKGWAPPVAAAQYESIARLGQSLSN